MKKISKHFLLLCGLALMLAAFPVSGQENAETEIRGNKKPIQDLIGFIKNKVEKDKTDLTKPFFVELKGVLETDGKMDAERSSFVRAEGDGQMVEIAKRTLEAINESGVFRYLKQLSAENITISLSQDENETSAIMRSDFESEKRVKTLVSGMKMMLQTAAMDKKLSADDKTVLNAAKVENDGKQLILNVTLPKAVFQEMINRRLVGEKVAGQGS